MLKMIFLLLALTLNLNCRAQDLKLEYNKNTDLTRYKTFRFGEGEIITPKDQRQIDDATLHQWVRGAITRELKEKGLQQLDSGADLTVSYITGTQMRSDAGNVGPLGLTPGANTSQTYMRDYRQGSLVVDLNDTKTNMLVWRMNASMNTAITDAEQSIDRVVSQGFKKFSIHPKKKKVKKKK